MLTQFPVLPFLEPDTKFSPLHEASEFVTLSLFGDTFRINRPGYALHHSPNKAVCALFALIGTPQEAIRRVIMGWDFLPEIHNRG